MTSRLARFFPPDRANLAISIDGLDPIFESCIRKNDCLMLFRHHANNVNSTDAYDERMGALSGKACGKNNSDWSE